LVNLFLPVIFKFHNFFMCINYGVEKLRFLVVVLAVVRIQVSVEFVRVEEVKGSAVQAVVRVTVDIEGSDRPACVVDTINRFIPA
ncbi:MAG: dehydratase, partial [Pseudomonadales bacterium]